MALPPPTPGKPFHPTPPQCQPLSCSDGSTTFKDPPAPPGLRVVNTWDPAGDTFDPSELWLAIVAAGSTLAQLPYGVRMTRTENFLLMISHGQLRLAPVSYQYCTIDSMVWGLWELGTQMAQRYPMPQRVPSFSAQLWTTRGWLGIIGVLRSESEIHEHEGLVAPARDRTPARSTSLSSSPMPSLSKRVDSGSIPCREDHDLVVEFQFLYHPLDPGQVFTAFLRSNTFFAAHGWQDMDVTMVAYGSGHQISLGLTEVTQGPGMKQLTWGLARIAMGTLWREVVMSFKADEGRFVDRPRFEKLSFILIYKGVKIGLGHLG